MGKLKNILLILLVLLVLILGSLLPMGAAKLQDKTISNVVQYGDLKALQLKLEEQDPKLSFQEKLSLVVHGIGGEVTEEVMRMSPGDVHEAAYAAFQPYADIYGLPLDNDMLEFYPGMAYNENDPSVSSYFWSVHMSLDVSQNDTITMILDDETGKLLAVELIDLDMDIPAEALWEFQAAVSSVYFEALRAEPVSAWPVETESAVIGEGVTQVATRYQFVDTLYGEVCVDICARNDGFVIFPN